MTLLQIKNQVWKSNGSSSGNVLLKDDLSADIFVKANGFIFFTGSDSSHGRELWITDGSVNGTLLLKDIHAGVNSSDLYDLTYSEGKLLFEAQDRVHGVELWQSDGTSDGTLLIKDINQTSTSSSNPRG